MGGVKRLEAVADSIEVMMIAHQYDALVGISGCDKSLPGTLMGMARITVLQYSYMEDQFCLVSGTVNK